MQGLIAWYGQAGVQLKLRSPVECFARSFFPVTSKLLPLATGPCCCPFTQKHSPWTLFSFIMCFFSSLEQRSSISKQNSFQTGSNLSFSCGGETRIPLWLQSSEDMEKCSKGRVTWNLRLFLSRLLDWTGLVFMPQMKVYPSPSLVYTPSHVLLIKFALTSNKRHFPCWVLWLHRGVHTVRFSFLLFKYWCLFSMWACSVTVSRGGDLHSSLFFFKCQKWFQFTSEVETHCPRGDWLNQM